MGLKGPHRHPDLSEEQVEIHGPLSDANAPPLQRQTREHHRVDTALFQRAQAMILSLQDVQHLLPRAPSDIQRHMAGPLTTLHAELSGLLFVALLMANIHPDADDQDVG